MRNKKSVADSLLGTLQVAVCILGALCVLASFQTAYGQDNGTKAAPEVKKEEKKEVKEIIKTGQIAGEGIVNPTGTFNVDTDGSTPGDQASAIGASVSRMGKDKCDAVVSNMSKDNSYSVSFKVIGKNNLSGQKQSEKYFSATLRPQQKVTRAVSCADNSNMYVELVSAKKLGK
jgi:hypothetical protein